MMRNLVRFVNIAITNKCNLQCRHCDIWRQEDKLDIKPGLLYRMLASDAISPDVDLTLTGGEPFLHKKFSSILDSVQNARPFSIHTISTNGTLTAKIVDFLRVFHRYAAPGFSFHISYDGVVYYKSQRMKSGGPVLRTIKAIRDFSPDINIVLKYTATSINYRDILPTYFFARENGLGFRIKISENAPNYTNNNSSNPFVLRSGVEKNTVIRSLFFIYNDNKNNYGPSEKLRLEATIRSLRGKGRKIRCLTPFNRVFLMPTGKVFTCIHNKEIGDLNNDGFEDIWNSAEARALRDRINRRGCDKCVSCHGYSAY